MKRVNYTADFKAEAVKQVIDRVLRFEICLLHTSHWQPGINGQLCGEHIVNASTRHGLEPDVRRALKQS